MILKALDDGFTVSKLKEETNFDRSKTFWFLSKTDEEISLVCRTEDVPNDATAREDGWRGFRIEGTLDFSLIGILAKITDVLAKDKIGVFVVSTYNTDYVFVKENNFDRAIALLHKKGYEIK